MEQETPQLGEIQDTGTFSGSLSHAPDNGSNTVYCSHLDPTAVLGLIMGRVKGSHCWPAPGCVLAQLLPNNGLATLTLCNNSPWLTCLIPSTEVDSWRHIRK